MAIDPATPVLALGPNRLTDRTVPARAADLARVLDGPCQVVSAICWRTPPDWRIARRTCPDTLLFLALAGSARLTLRGATVAVGPGDLAIVPAGTWHAANYAPGCTRWDVVAVHLLHADPHGRDVWSGFAASVHRAPAWGRRLLDLTAELNRGGGQRLGEALARGLATALLLDGAEYAAPAVGDPRIAAALAALDADPALPIATLAARVRLGPARFRARFAEVMGESPKAWQQRRRLERACRLLRATAEPVQAIARELGFASEQHFSQAFRAAHGCAPGVWRRREEGL